MAYKKQNTIPLLLQTITPFIPLIVAAVSISATLFMSIALLTYHPQDSSPFYYSSVVQPIHNTMGWIGAYTASWLFYLFGIMAYALIPYACFLIFQLIIRKSSYKQEWDRIIAGAYAIVLGTVWCTLSKVGAQPYRLAGGIIGKHTALFLENKLSYTGTYALLYASTCALIFILTRLHFIVALQGLFNALHFLYATRQTWLYPIVHALVFVTMHLVTILKKIFVGIWRTIRAADVQEADESLFTFEHGSYTTTTTNSIIEQEKLTESTTDTHQVAPSEKKEHEDVPSFLTEKHAGKIQDQKTDMPHTSNNNKKKSYRLPSLSLFSEPSPSNNTHNQQEQKHLAQLLEEKLARFGVQGEVVSIKPGPVITLFEYQPSIDAKVSKIMALENDLALALQALSVRIVAPIPGTNKVGFEVANKKRISVRMADIVRASTFQSSNAALPLVLGQDTSGGHVVVDLVNMPHLLVAGSTGSGKSVALNAMLASLVYKATPEQLKLIIIDPKRLEFAAFHDIAHLLFPVITDPRKAAPVVKWLVKEMEDRYEYMAQKGARSIADYKAQCIQNKEEDKLPYIVLIIDELADLMMVAGKEIEESIARLAQMARAAGIHLIIATQRPSVDVLTGVIKVNFPSRISFRVTSKIDSRTILDTGGAENLLGKGDMLFMDAHSAGLQRIHGAYVSDAEINALAQHIRAQQPVQYQDIQEALEAMSAHTDIQDEPLLPEVLEFLTTVEEISISSLQRRFRIGYNRSARLIEILESQGRVMPATGSKMRKVLKS